MSIRAIEASSPHDWRFTWGGRSPEQADFHWLRKTLAGWRSQAKPSLYLRVVVWGPDGQQVPGLAQEFTSNDLAAARRYAKQIVRDGNSMAMIAARVSGYHPRRGFGDHMIQDLGGWEHE